MVWAALVSIGFRVAGAAAGVFEDAAEPQLQLAIVPSPTVAACALQALADAKLRVCGPPINEEH
jgi:hypothetical protein